jgi:hypothetical protein
MVMSGPAMATGGLLVAVLLPGGGFSVSSLLQEITTARDNVKRNLRMSLILTL